MGEKRKAYRLLVRKPEGIIIIIIIIIIMDNIKMDLREIRWGRVDCIGFAQDRDKWRALVNVVMNLQVP
jgi:hypothetical protein